MTTRMRWALVLCLAGCRLGSDEPTTLPDDATSRGTLEDGGGMPDDEPVEEEEPY